MDWKDTYNISWIMTDDPKISASILDNPAKTKIIMNKEIPINKGDKVVILYNKETPIIIKNIIKVIKNLKLYYLLFMMN